jgi:hypothetical protein
VTNQRRGPRSSARTCRAWRIDPGGLFIAYDVSYRVADRVTVRAPLSYGARDGPVHVGGGLGSALDF